MQQVILVMGDHLAGPVLDPYNSFHVATAESELGWLPEVWCYIYMQWRKYQKTAVWGFQHMNPNSCAVHDSGEIIIMWGLLDNYISGANKCNDCD